MHWQLCRSQLAGENPKLFCQQAGSYAGQADFYYRIGDEAK